MGRLGAVLAARKPPNERSENIIFPLFFHGYCVRAPLAGDLRSTSPPWLHWCRLGAVSVPSWPVLGASLVRLGASWVRLGASWGRLGHQKPPHGRPKNIMFHLFFKVFVPVRLLRAILAQHSLPDRLGTVFGSSWGVFGSSWGVLGASWRHLGASWRRLGASWARLGKLKNLIFPWFFQCFCVPRLHWHNLASASVLKRLGRVLGTSWERLGHVLGVLGSVLGASWGVLGAAWGHLGASWGRLGASGARLGKLKNLMFHWFFQCFCVPRPHWHILPQLPS